MIYRPLPKLDLSSASSRKAVMLARHNICAASFHTRLDAVDGGVSDCLLHAVQRAEDFKNTEILYYDDIPIGRVVTLNRELCLQTVVTDIRKSLKKFYKLKFSCDTMFNLSYISGSGRVKKIGVAGGGGMSFAKTAAEMGADTFFTGEGKYSDILDLYESYNLNIITGGHFETEAVVLPFIKEKILEKFPHANADCFIGEHNNP